jgi:hypothetical protein
MRCARPGWLRTVVGKTADANPGKCASKSSEASAPPPGGPPCGNENERACRHVDQAGQRVNRLRQHAITGSFAIRPPKPAYAQVSISSPAPRRSVVNQTSKSHARTADSG